jgi:hypothetical protein
VHVYREARSAVAAHLRAVTSPRSGAAAVNDEDYCGVDLPVDDEVDHPPLTALRRRWSSINSHAIVSVAAGARPATTVHYTRRRRRGRYRGNDGALGPRAISFGCARLLQPSATMPVPAPPGHVMPAAAV